MECKFCKKVVEQPEGKRKKEFCNNTCRSNFWYAQNKKGKPSVTLTDNTKPNKELKPPTTPKTNYTINTSTPKNLIELKTMCPFKEIGDERSAWIATERQKYGI